MGQTVENFPHIKNAQHRECAYTKKNRKKLTAKLKKPTLLILAGAAIVLG